MTKQKSKINIKRISENNFEAVVIDKDGLREIIITAISQSHENFLSIFNKLFSTLKTYHAKIVKFDIFCPAEKFNIFMKLTEDVRHLLFCPITWIEGGNCFNENRAIFQIHAIADANVRSLFINKKQVAFIYEDDFAKYLFIGNITPKNKYLSHKKQAINTFKKIEKTLTLAGMTISNIVRTWFYNDNITLWYNKFNFARNNFFNNKKTIFGFLPASTGIGAKNPSKTAFIASIFAIKAKNKCGIKIRSINSPLQNPPSEYGSYFSRAIEIAWPNHRKILVSGTASINDKGQTIHIEKIEKQIDHTMNVIKSILESRDMDFSNITRSIAYIKNAKHVSIFCNYWRKNINAPLPLAISNNDICRDNLLFEIEVDADKNI